MNVITLLPLLCTVPLAILVIANRYFVVISFVHRLLANVVPTFAAILRTLHLLNNFEQLHFDDGC